MPCAVKWIFVGLVLLRLPSLAQPAGADQSLYAYVGDRILHGELPYRDAWDQKPPAVHYTYAALWAAWPDERVVAAADLLIAIGTALVIWRLGRRLSEGPGGGEAAALLFLLLTNPALTRLGGVRVRGQTEVFIGLVVALAFLLVHDACRATPDRRRAGILATAAGAFFGLAFLYKYNAGAYLLAGIAAAWIWTRSTAIANVQSRPVTTPKKIPDPELRAAVLLAWLITGFGISVGLMLTVFAAGGALEDLYHATISYNLLYSGETYASRWDLVRYLFTFPVRHARLDSLWFLGGLGSAVLTLAASQRAAPGGHRHFERLVVPIWVAAACLAIAVNGSRGLPQYFLQAYPPLALAAGLAGALVWPRLKPAGRLAIAVLLTVAVARITNFEKIADYTMWDLRYWTGGLTRHEYLSRFGERASDDKYSALATAELGHWLKTNVPANERVLVFGFSPGALLTSGHASASRFFWSRPLIVGFGEGRQGYGVSGFVSELKAARPAAIVLQRNDWVLEREDSATFFLNQPAPRQYLETHYQPAGELGNFVLWRRSDQ